MNGVNGFTFYKNYFELIDNLPRKDKLAMLEAIVDYVFKDVEPNLTGLNNAIWNNIVLPINKSKNNSLRSINHGAPQGNHNASKKTNQKQTKNKPNSNQKQTNNISNFLFLISNFILNNNYSNNTKLILEDWLKYKCERKENYTEIGFNKLLTQIKNNIEIYDEEKLIETIEYSMANNYKGILFDRLKGLSKNKNINSKKQDDEFTQVLKGVFDGTIQLEQNNSSTEDSVSLLL